MKKSLWVMSALCVLCVGCDQFKKSDQPPKNSSNENNKIGALDPSARDTDSSLMNRNASNEDQTIMDNVRNVFINDKNLSSKARHVKITISNNSILLEGSVANENDKTEISSKIKSVPGVKKVEDRLIVGSNNNATSPAS